MTEIPSPVFGEIRREFRELDAGENTVGRAFEELFARGVMKRGVAQDFGLLRSLHYVGLGEAAAKKNSTVGVKIFLRRLSAIQGGEV